MRGFASALPREIPPARRGAVEANDSQAATPLGLGPLATKWWQRGGGEGSKGDSAAAGSASHPAGGSTSLAGVDTHFL
eukprot:1258546-Alexandrium_andersonii.AAC.1